MDIRIFLAELQNIIDEIEKIDNGIESNTKAGIPNIALSENLRFIKYSSTKITGINVGIMLKM